MDIRFKQPQIEAALRGYIIKQGINLTGRTVEIVFTAGRGGNGLMADIALSEGNLQEDVPPVRQLIEDTKVPFVDSLSINTTNPTPSIADVLNYHSPVLVTNAAIKKCIVNESNTQILDTELPSATETIKPPINPFG